MIPVIRTDPALRCLDAMLRWPTLPQPVDRFCAEAGEGLLPLSLHPKTAFLLHTLQMETARPELVLKLLKERIGEARDLFERHFRPGSAVSAKGLLETVSEGLEFWPASSFELGLIAGHPDVTPADIPCLLGAMVAFQDGGFGQAYCPWGIQALESVFPVGLPIQVNVSGETETGARSVDMCPKSWMEAEAIFDLLCQATGKTLVDDEVDLGQGTRVKRLGPGHILRFEVSQEERASRQTLHYQDRLQRRTQKIVELYPTGSAGRQLIASLVLLVDRGYPSSEMLACDSEEGPRYQYLMGPGFLLELDRFPGPIQEVPFREVSLGVRNTIRGLGGASPTSRITREAGPGHTEYLLDIGGQTEEGVRQFWHYRSPRPDTINMRVMALDPESQAAVEGLLHTRTGGVFLESRWDLPPDAPLS